MIMSGLKTTFQIHLLGIPHTSTNYKVSKIYKISPNKNPHTACTHKHQTFKKTVPLFLPPLKKKAHKARTHWHCGSIKILPSGRCGIESHTHLNIHRLPYGKKYIYVRFPMNCHVARWPRGLGDGCWPQVWDLPKIPPYGWCGIESRMCWNIHRLPHSKKYI